MTEPWVSCPHCGGDIRPDATFCRHCGSSDEDGWRDEGDAEGAETGGEDDFDYEAFVDENFSPHPVNTGTPPMWRTVAIILLVLLAGFAMLQMTFLFR